MTAEGENTSRTPPALPTQRLVLAVILGLLIIGALLTPLAGDVLVAFGGAFQADWIPCGFPCNVYRSWGNMRGIGYKLLVYVLYQVAGAFVQPPHLLGFQAAAKLVYYPLFFGAAYGFLRVARRQLGQLGFTVEETFFLFVLSTLSVSQLMALQAEELAWLFTVGMTVCAVNERRSWNYASGVFVPLLLACKLITVADILFPIGLVWCLGSAYRDRLKRLLVTVTLFGLLTALVYLLALPVEVRDAVDAAYFQSPLRFRGLGTLTGFLQGLIIAAQHAPILFTGLVCALVLCRSLHRGEVGLLALVFAICTAPVIVQGRWHAYHYFGFLAFAFVAIALALRRLPPYARLRGREGIVGFTLVVWVLSIWIVNVDVPFRASFANSNRYKFGRYEVWVGVLRGIDSQFKLSDEPAVLFLGSGVANYVIRSPSYSRYFYQAPLQRVKSNPNMAQTPVFKDVLESVLAYRGRYVYLEPSWFDVAAIPALQSKLAIEYESVFRAEGHGPLDVAVLQRRGKREDGNR